MLLEGVFPAITTPFYPDGKLYLRKLAHNVAHYSRTQLAGMVVLGPTGEAAMLSDEERRQILAEAIAAAAADKVMIADISQESVSGTLALAEAAAELNYDAVRVCTPQTYRRQLHRTDGPQREMLTYFRAVADHSPLPILLHSEPALTLYELPVKVVSELSEHPNIIGIDDASEDVGRVKAIVEATQSVRRTVTVTPTFAAVTRRMLKQPAEPQRPELAAASALSAGGVALATPTAPAVTIKTREKEIGFSVLTGRASRMRDAFDAGASGAILPFAACAPQCCYEVWTAWKERDEVLAVEKQERIREASIQVAERLGVPGLKVACDLNGYYGGHSRLPLLPLTGDERLEVASRMADIRY